MIKTMLIDDEPLARSIIAEYLQPYNDIKIVQECNDGFEGIKAITNHKPDLVFLDVQMPKINGFEMLELLDAPPLVIFTTAFDNYAIKAFEAHAIDYLLKPFSKERFDRAIKKWMNENQRVESRHALTLPYTLNSNRVVVKTGSKVSIIPAHEIHYLEADDDYVKIVTADGSFLKNRTMNFFEETLDKTMFVRVHRSFMLHIQQVARIEPYQKENHIAILKSGAKVPVSKQGYGKLKSILGI